MDKPGLIPVKTETGEVYTTSNIIIRLLAHNWQKKIKELLKSINARQLKGLDVGCAEGHMLFYLHKRKAIGDMTAVDIDEEKLEYAKKHYPFCTYKKGDINSLDFEDHTFDYIIAAEILEHLPDPELALNELRRISKKGAFILISVPYEPFFHWGNIVRGQHLKRGGKTPSHVNFWNRNEFKKFINDFILIEKEHHIKTFPWMVFLGRFR